MVKIAGTLLIATDGTLLLHRRDERAPTSPKKLSLFGGSMEEGETSEVAARRELSEETSLDVASLVLEPLIDFEKGGKKYYFYKSITEVEDFQVFEGVGMERYTVKEAINRNDLAAVAVIAINALIESE